MTREAYIRDECTVSKMSDNNNDKIAFANLELADIIIMLRKTRLRAGHSASTQSPPAELPESELRAEDSASTQSPPDELPESESSGSAARAFRLAELPKEVFDFHIIPAVKEAYAAYYKTPPSTPRQTNEPPPLRPKTKRSTN